MLTPRQHLILADLTANHRGWCRAIKGRYLAQKMGLPCNKIGERAIQEDIYQLRMSGEGKNIGSLMEHPYGYYICETEEDFAKYYGPAEIRFAHAFQALRQVVPLSRLQDAMRQLSLEIGGEQV
jgi:hypothetical protein